MGACAGLCVCSCPTAVPDAVLVVAALCKSPLPDVGRKFICSSSNVADMVVPTLDNRGNMKTQTMPYEACVFAKQETTCQRRCENKTRKTST